MSLDPAFQSRSALAGGCSNNSVTEQRLRRHQDPTDHWITSFRLVET
jgi:hypothetical protein